MHSVYSNKMGWNFGLYYNEIDSLDSEEFWHCLANSNVEDAEIDFLRPSATGFFSFIPDQSSLYIYDTSPVDISFQDF